MRFNNNLVTMDNQQSSNSNSTVNSPRTGREKSEDKTDVISSDDSITVVEINRDDSMKVSSDINPDRAVGPITRKTPPKTEGEEHEEDDSTHRYRPSPELLNGQNSFRGRGGSINPKFTGLLRGVPKNPWHSWETKL